MKYRLLLTVVLAVILTGVLVGAVLVSQVHIPAVGNVKTVGIEAFSDANYAVPLTQINWGALSPGETKNFTCYVKSTSNVNASLTVATNNWSPSQAATYITLNWNREGTIIKPGEVLTAIFTIQVSQAVQNVSSFNFDIVITATEA
ncbi:MAG: hypothetical protein NWE99_10930 [Candidatus Bathyarchaeota archaeon]|nr:hypothetical protein [Candidatus Bathyarchaeota archaeon]